MRSRRRFPIEFVALLALFSLASISCRNRGSAGATSSPTPAGAGTPVTGRLTAEMLHPALHSVGDDAALPERIVFELNTPVFESSWIGTTATTTELAIDPPLDGNLKITSPSTLEFTPSAPLAFNTGYTFTLKKVQTKDGMLEGPDGGWSGTLSTPDFKLVRLEPLPVDSEHRHVSVDLVFSGDVDVASAKSFVHMSVGGKPIDDVRLSATDKRRVIRATLASNGLVAGAHVKVALSKGLRSAGKAARKAPATDLSFSVVAGLPVEIKWARMKEGATGHYVSIVCNDQAAGGSEYVWDREVGEDYYVSRRCSPKQDEVASHIHFQPAVKFTVAPARHGFNVYGDFHRGEYAMTIDAGLGSEDGGILASTFSSTFNVAPRTPSIGFVGSGRYLPRSAWKSLAVTHRNVSEVHLVIRQVPPENLVFWMSDDSTEAATDRTSNVILDRSIAVSGKDDADETSWIDVADLLPATTRGVLEISLSATGARAAASRLLLTELGIVAKKDASGDGVNVWALGLDSVAPVPGVQMTLIRKSGKTVARCTTDANGGCRLSKSSAEDLDPAEPFAILARKGDDQTYLKYSELKLGIADSEVQGDPYSSTAAYRAAFYSDRGVYRPGDTAHLVAVLRDETGVAPPAGLPVTLTLLDPRAQVSKKTVARTNEGGLVSLDVPFEAFADTGSWNAQATVAGIQVGSYGINVEEFVPERMKVEAATKKAGYAFTDEVPVDVSARYLFGGSAEGSEVELTCSIEPSQFHPKQNANFDYGVWRDPRHPVRAVSLGQAHGTLDEKGMTELSCPALDAGESFDGAGRLVANVSVMEAGSGRSTFQQVSVPVHPAPYYVGLSTTTQKAETGKPVHVEGVVVDWEGNLVTKGAPDTVAIEFLRVEPQYGDWWDDDDGERYQQSLQTVREGAATAKVVGGKFRVDVTPEQAAGSYVVRATAGDARTDLTVQGSMTGWWWWDRSETRLDLTPRPAKPTSIVVTAPRQAKVGESTTVSIRSPYKGRALFTAETDHVIASEWKTVGAGDNTWSFTVKNFTPNVYVSAFVVKDPHLESAKAYMPDRAFGITSVTVEPTQFLQSVKLEVPAQVHSNSTLTVTLDLGKQDGPTFATVAAVDEGILQLTRFQSPDPMKTIFARRALGVETYETLGWTLLMQPAGTSSSHGGDEGEESASQGRVQPVKPVALWSGVIPVPKSGKATVSFDVPTYRGQLRVMAVTAGAKRIGHASTEVTVADPIVVQTTLPRFLVQGDEFQVPVFLTNTTKKPIDVDVTLTAEDLPVPGMERGLTGDAPNPIRFLGKPEGKARIEPGKSATMVFQAKAMQIVGAAKFRVLAKGTSSDRGERYESRDELDVPFSPAGPREREVQKFEVAGNDLDLTGKIDGWVPTSEKTDLWLTTNPWGDSFSNLAELIQYPYGCIEQTTSTTWPLLTVSDLIESSQPDLVAGKKLEDMVMHGIRRDLSMQTPSGGFAYWPGGTEPNAWGTAFATQMLLDAQKAGYPVPQERLDSAIEWLANRADSSTNLAAGGGNYHGFVQASTDAYVHYVLALAGKGRAARIQQLLEAYPKTGAQGRDGESVYMLEAALWLTGDHRYEKQLKGLDASPVKLDRANDWSFYSDARARGFELATFDDLFGNDKAGDALADVVAENLKGAHGYWNTQEMLWSVNGLGKRVRGIAKEMKPGVIVADGRTLEGKVAKTRGGDRSWSIRRASELKTLHLKMSEKAKGKVYLFASSEGVKKGATYKVGGNGLKVERSYKQLDGNAVDKTGLHLADLVVVEVTISNESREPIQNIALVDRLPAGFEIENARLGRGNTIDWVSPDDQWKSDYVNVRDDRIEAFGTLEAGETKKIVYTVRAVTSGTFTVPPVEAEAMYDGRIWAREAGDTVKIEGPWAGFLL